MKKISIILFLFLSARALSQQGLDNADLKSEGLKGKVKSVKQQYKGWAKDTAGNFAFVKNPSSERYYSQQYDEMGKKVHETHYSTNDSIEEKTIYKYDTGGNLIERITHYPSFNVDSKIIYKYDSNNNSVLVYLRHFH